MRRCVIISVASLAVLSILAGIFGVWATSWNEGSGDDVRGEEDEVVFHAYWFGQVGRKQALSIKSVLATQTTRPRVTLWLDATDQPDNAWLSQLLSLNVTVSKYDPVVLARGTPLENKTDLITESTPLAVRSSRSDWARMLILFTHGGLYFDLDVMFVRDIRPLIKRFGEFAYPWASRRGKLNTAVFRLRKGSAVATEIVQRAANERAPSAKHGLSALTIDRKPRGLHVAPYEVLDFCWLDWELCPRFDFSWFFKPFDRSKAGLSKKADDQLRSSFAYHCESQCHSLLPLTFQRRFPPAPGHNQWETVIQTGSTFELWESRFDSILGVPHRIASDAVKR